MLTYEALWWVLGAAAYITVGNALWNAQHHNITKGFATDPVHVAFMRFITTFFWLPVTIYVILKGR